MATASTYTYNLDFSVSSIRFTGTITTDTTGLITNAADIIDWNIIVGHGVNNFTRSNSVMTYNGGLNGGLLYAGPQD